MQRHLGVGRVQSARGVEPDRSSRAPAGPHPSGAWSVDFHGARRLAASAILSTFVALGGVAVSAPAVAAASYDPAADGYSMANLAAITGASAFWDAGYTGRGVDVAIIDTGVAPVEGLDGAGKVIHGPDLSFESQSDALRYLDTNGHGTFMAGLIAGRDDALTGDYSSAPASVYRGLAPDARILSVKVGVADGGVDVSQMIAAIDWVVQHRHDHGLNVRIINISYGTNSRQSYLSDPLAYAAEQAWRKGIVVVAAAGNTGYQFGAGAPGLADPAYDPFVIAVGGYDSMGTAAAADDVMGAYSASSARCPSCKSPDFATVGSHLQGLRVPGSYLDQKHPEAILGSRYFRGSGTSQAAAVASGEIALLLSRFPNLTPDQVKRFVCSATQQVPRTSRLLQGCGEVNLARLVNGYPLRYTQRYPYSTGTGSLEQARGSDHLTRDGVILEGEIDIFGHPFDSAAMAKAEASATSWSGGTWNGNVWSGSSWSGSSWSGSSWSGSSWSGSSWSGSSWSGSSWSGSSWSGSSWSGSSWSGSSWSGSSWSTCVWETGTWN